MDTSFNFPEIIAYLNDKLEFKIKSLRIGNEDHHSISPSLAKKYYPSIFSMTKKYLNF